MMIVLAIGAATMIAQIASRGSLLVLLGRRSLLQQRRILLGPKWLSKRLIKFRRFHEFWKIWLILVHGQVALWKLYKFWTVSRDLSLLKIPKLLICSLSYLSNSCISYCFWVLYLLRLLLSSILCHYYDHIVVIIILWKFVNLILILWQHTLSSNLYDLLIRHPTSTTTSRFYRRLFVIYAVTYPYISSLGMLRYLGS
jgi:hypothetical protein